MRLPLRIAGLALAALVLAIWAGWDLPRRTLLPTPADSAADAAADRADRLARWLVNRPVAMDDAASLARAVTGEGQGDTEVLSYAGRRSAGNVELDLRITVSGTFTGTLVTENVTETRCFRLRQRGRHGGFSVRGRSCPYGRPAVTLPPAPPDPELPDGFEARLTAELRRLPVTGRTEPAVRAAVTRALAGAAASVETASAGRTVGVAVSADRDDCVLAAVDGRVDVWRPRWITLQPGEDGCNPATAARRGG